MIPDTQPTTAGLQNQGIDEPVYEVAVDQRPATPRNHTRQGTTARNHDSEEEQSYQYIDTIDSQPNDTAALSPDVNNVYQPLGERHQYQQAATKPERKKVHDVGGRRCIEKCLMATVLLISLLALFLVILNIAGVVGPGCSCANKGIRNLSYKSSLYN